MKNGPLVQLIGKTLAQYTQSMVCIPQCFKINDNNKAMKDKNKLKNLALVENISSRHNGNELSLKSTGEGKK